MMRLEFIEGPGLDMPAIQLSGRDPCVVEGVRRALGALSERPIALHAIPGVEAIEGCHVTAQLRERARGVVRIAARAFIWELNPAGWDQVIGLLEPFAVPPPAGNRFQFLDRGGDATVIISLDGHW